MSLTERVKEHDSPQARWVIAVVALLLLAAGGAALLQWLRPSDVEKGRVLARACFEADELHDARLLGEARRTYWAIRSAQGSDVHCTSAGRRIASEQMEAALQREQGAEYMRAAQRSGAPTVRLQQQARRALARSLDIDPYQQGARKELDQLLSELPPPRDRDQANARCRLGGRLRAAGLLPEATTVYTQALSAGRHSTCTRYGLRLTRTDIAQAQQALSEARMLAAEDRADDVVRRNYVDALAIDSSLAFAHTALDDHAAVAPREGTLFGRLDGMIADAVDWLGRAVDWLAEHVTALALAAVAALLVLLLVMVVLMFVTRAKFVRGGLDKRPLRWLPLGRFTRPRMLISKFTPEDQASGAGAIFAQYLPLAPILEDAPAELVAPDTSDLPQDLIESPEVERDPLQDAATLIAAFPQAGAVAATVKYLVDAAPRWDANISGHLLEPANQGHGIRVVVNARGGRPGGTRTFWAGNLPGPRFSDKDVTAARYALAIMAAAWAHDTINR